MHGAARAGRLGHRRRRGLGRRWQIPRVRLAGHVSARPERRSADGRRIAPSVTGFAGNGTQPRLCFGAMRSALLWLAAAACASGGNGTSDASVDSSIYTIDAPTCGNLPCNAIYVSRAGNDASPGSKMAPMKTLDAAMAKAMMTVPPLAVFVAAGSYPEQVHMRAGIALYGGFDETWTQNAAVTTEISAPSPAVTFDNIQTGTSLANVTIKSADATGTTSGSSIAVLVTGSKLI